MTPRVRNMKITRNVNGFLFCFLFCEKLLLCRFCFFKWQFVEKIIPRDFRISSSFFSDDSKVKTRFKNISY